MQAAKAVDFFWRLLGHAILVADAEQAYIQADMQGDPTWVCLPPEARPEWWRKQFPDLCRPVFRLKLRCTVIRTRELTGNSSATHMTNRWDSLLSDGNGHLAITIQNYV